MMKKTTAYECEFCDKIYKNVASCRSHEYKCYFNPRTRSCASCAFNRFEEEYFKDGVLFNYVACIANVPVEMQGLQTRCDLYLAKKYSDDPEIMTPVIAKYKFEDQYIGACKKRMALLQKVENKMIL